MLIRIKEDVLADSRWFPILDVVLLYVEDGRHRFDIGSFQDLKNNSWLRARPRYFSDLVEQSLRSQSGGSMARDYGVIIDSTAPHEGVIEGEFTKLNPRNCLEFLSQPFHVLVENEWFDGAFLLWMALAVKRPKFVEAYRSGRFAFRHAGGKDSLVRSAQVLSNGVWPSPHGKRKKAMKLWSCAVLDNDSRWPGDNPNERIVEELGKYTSFTHQLKRRSIESYIQRSSLIRFDDSPGFCAKVDALFQLKDVQRRHFHMKNGFRKKGVDSLIRAEHEALMDPEEVEFFADTPDEVWGQLLGGLGRNLSGIFCNSDMRPTSNDSKQMAESDVEEIRSLIAAIEERI
jgi:hypothetical protein